MVDQGDTPQSPDRQTTPVVWLLTGELKSDASPR